MFRFEKKYLIAFLKKIPPLYAFIKAIWYFWLRIKRSLSIFFYSYKFKEIISLRDFVYKHNLGIVKVFDATRIYTPEPTTFPSEDQSDLTSPGDHYDFPSVYIAKLFEAKVYSGTNLVFLNKSVICHDLYDFRRNTSSEELHGIHQFSYDFKKMRRFNSNLKTLNIESAAPFLDSCASNYAHWLTEVLPRIAVFCTIEQYRDVPIIIDSGLHPNIIESLELIAGSDREVIYQEKSMVISVKTLYMTSVTGYVPFGKRDIELEDWNHGMFSPQCFELLKKKILPYADRVSFESEHKKIYLCRKAQYRNIVNAKEVERLILKNGYFLMNPEELSFIQQVALINRSNAIVGVSGAAMANLIFAPSSTRCIILIGKVKGTSYWYWQNMALSTEKEVYYVMGDTGSDNDIHSNFKTNLKDINKALI
jgi:capsular polysaccharide biosynthesis protein